MHSVVYCPLIAGGKECSQFSAKLIKLLNMDFSAFTPWILFCRNPDHKAFDPQGVEHVLILTPCRIDFHSLRKFLWPEFLLVLFVL
mgnify:FL=1